MWCTGRIDPKQRRLALPATLILGVFLLGCQEAAISNGQAEQSVSSPASTDDQSSSVEGLVSERAMVIGTTGAASLEGGLAMLKRGGNAVDAALATSLGQICLAAGSWVSYAGILTMVYYDAATGELHGLNAGYNTVRDETDPFTIPAPDVSKGFAGFTYEPDGRTTLVPGFMAGVEAAQKRFGRLSFGEIFEPAIACAEEGFEWNAGLAGQYAFRKDVLKRLPETRAVFVKDGGSDYAPGDTFKQPALAETLRRVADEGAAYMYEGPWAEKMVAAVQADGGKLTMADMAAYEVIWSDPVRTQYNGYDVYVHGLPALGGVNTVEALNIAEAAELAEMGHYTQSPEAFYWLSYLTRVATAAATSNEAGLPEGIDMSVQGRLTKENAARIWQAMAAGKFPDVPLPQDAPAHSDGVVAWDEDGNMVAIVHTINAVSWGATGINIDGVSIPDSASFQQQAIAEAGPGNRLPDPTNPGLVFKDGKPFMAFSSIGGGLHQRTIGNLVSVLNFGMTPQEANNQPHIGSTKFVFVDGAIRPDAAQSIGPGDFEPAYLAKVNALGLETFEDATLRGYWIGIQKNPSDNKLYGGMVSALALGGRAVGY